MNKCDSSAVIDLFNNLWINAIHKDTIVSNYWYSYYDDSFNKLIASHVGLFTGLIAIAIALFAIKYWLDNKKFEESFDKKLEGKLRDAHEKLDRLKENSVSAIRASYLSNVKMLLKMDGKKECIELLVELVNAYLGTDYEKTGKVINEMVGVLPDVLSRLSESTDVEVLKQPVTEMLKKICEAMNDENLDLSTFLDKKSVQKVIENFGLESAILTTKKGVAKKEEEKNCKSWKEKLSLIIEIIKK